MRWFLLAGLLAAWTPATLWADGDRLAHLDEFCDPYYVDGKFPKLTTPQWVGEEGVEAVVVLAIDDMRDTARYEEYLRPILNRLKQIDGRAAVSIMTCSVNPADPQLQTWLKEGVSLETHTFDHPCPCLQGGDFSAAKNTYERCVGLLASVPGNRPVAFRMPCCDSRNTPSPRFWMEVFNRTTPGGAYLTIDSSVFNIFTANDTALPRELVVEPGKETERFRKYLPFPSFVNTIENYPYPYVIGRLCWEFPCVVPSDWEGQNIQRPNNPDTVRDMKLALDATVLKQGVYNLVFHPHGWIRNDQIVELIDHAVEKHGRKVKFLTFREAQERIDAHLLAGQPLRDAQGRDNGVRLLDLNNDGYQDVVIGNAQVRRTRVWSPQERRWIESDFPTTLVQAGQENVEATAAQFGVIDDSPAVLLRLDGAGPKGWRFDGRNWQPDDRLTAIAGETRLPTITTGQAARLRDVDGDGRCELIISDAQGKANAGFAWDPQNPGWRQLAYALPAGVSFVDAQGRDAGLRWVDLDGDGDDDVLFSNERQFSLHLFDSPTSGWSIEVVASNRGEGEGIPMVVRQGTNNGAWFHSQHLWVQNEDTSRLPDGVDRRSFQQLLEMANRSTP